jgi:hexokinase
VTLHGDKSFSLRQQKYKVSETLKTGEVTTLFGAGVVLFSKKINLTSLPDYLADSVDAFLTDSGSPTAALPPSLTHESHANVLGNGDTDQPYISLALTFSFPVEQTALDSGKLLTWTKGFAAKNAIGKDVVKLLQDAFDRKHIHVKCVALVNDVSISIYNLVISFPQSSLPRFVPHVTILY